MIALATLVAFAFSSCKKDGVFQPKQKIATISESRVTRTVSGTTTIIDTIRPYVTEEWIWEGKNLSSITLRDKKGKEEGKISFKYDDKNRISDISSAHETAVYTYNKDKRLDNIKLYDGKELEDVFHFVYDGKVLTGIVDTMFNAGLIKSNLVSRIFPNMIAEQFSVPQNMTRGNEIFVTNLTFEWDGKNIAQINSVKETPTCKSTTTYNYEYDAKLNPQYGMSAMCAMSADESFLSKNNVIKVACHDKTNGKNGMSILDSESNTEIQYNYEYDGKVPASVSYTTIFTIGGTTTTTEYTTYYKYVE